MHLGLLLISLIVVAGLFGTVHNRNSIQVQEARVKSGLDRFDESILAWINGGFFRYGGMLILPKEQAYGFYKDQLPPETTLPPNSVFAYRNGTASYLIPIYLAEKIYIKLTGHFSLRLLLIYNQILIAFIGIAIGSLAFRISRDQGLPDLHSFALATACLVTFQTFPPSLNTYWEANYLSITLLAAICLISVDYNRWPGRRSRVVIRTAIATVIAFGEPATGLSFLMLYTAVRAILSERGLTASDVMSLFIVPLGFVFAYTQMQHLLARANNDNVYFIGTNRLSRSGLDGDTQYYKDHWDLLIRGHVGRYAPQLVPLANWHTLMTASACGAAYLLSRYTIDQKIREPIVAIIAALGFYFPFAFVFSQVVFVHPYYYDLSLVVPCILVTFGVLPAYIERRTNYTGIAVFIAFIAAGLYAFVQLRTYSTAFPTVS